MRWSNDIQRPGEFLAIVGAAGGLGHLAIQYANAMGLRVIALDLGADKTEYCRSRGAEFAIDVTSPDVAAQVQAVTKGGAHGILVLAPQKRAFDLAVSICRRKGFIVCIGLPPGTFEFPVLDVVIKRITIRGSIVGTRKDLQECLDLAARGKVHSDVEIAPFEDAGNVLQRLRDGTIKGRVVLKIGDIIPSAL